MPSGMPPKPDGSTPSGAYPRIARPVSMPIKFIVLDELAHHGVTVLFHDTPHVPMIRKPSCSLRRRA